MNRTEYKNRHRKEHYDSLLFVFPKGEKDRIKQAAAELKMSVNEYLYTLVQDDLASGRSRLGEKLNPEFTEEQQKLLYKWQIAQKYRDMIQSMHVETINGMNKHYTIDLGVLLSSSIEVKEIAGKKVFNVADGFLLACFEHDVTDETVKAIAQMKPYYAVFRDSSMANDSVATNFEQIFETYSPDTVRKVL
ncbi:MAG: hypothetical protein Q4C91_08265 [Eubacteriales bacterium]|nr:hypothetical protein [Eubacteriales bacterium]